MLNENSTLALVDSWVVGNSATVDPDFHNPGNLPLSRTGTTVAYNNGSPTANLAVLAAVPPVTLQGTHYLTYVVAPYGSPVPEINQGVGTLPRKGSNPNYFAAGTATATALADTSFTLTSSGHANQTAAVAYAPNGVPGVPYSGSAASVPGRLEVERFDNGGEAVAYHDLDAANNGGGYRTGEGVDIFADAGRSGGFGVGWVETGEWLEYSVNAARAGCYGVEVHAATPVGGSLLLQRDGLDASGAQAVPNTGGYASWQTVPISGVSLTAGVHRLRLIALAGGVNLDYLQFSELGNSAPTAAAGGPYTTIEGVGRSLRASRSSDPDQACGDSIVKYEWDLNSDGVFSVFPAEVLLTWPQIEAQICGGGCVEGVAYPLTLRVTDGSGLTDTAATTFTAVPKSVTPNDFDGDRRSDIGCYYPPGGTWYEFRSAEGFWQTTFGYAETLPVTGDFDGDGKTDYGIYHPDTGSWSVSQSAEGLWETTFGYAGTIPVVGDFDGDGRDDIGCYYPAGGELVRLQEHGRVLADAVRLRRDDSGGRGFRRRRPGRHRLLLPAGRQLVCLQERGGLLADDVRLRRDDSGGRGFRRRRPGRHRLLLPGRGELVRLQECGRLLADRIRLRRHRTGGRGFRRRRQGRHRLLLPGRRELVRLQEHGRVLADAVRLRRGRSPSAARCASPGSIAAESSRPRLYRKHKGDVRG